MRILKTAFSKLKTRWILVFGAAFGILYTTNKLKNIYWGLLLVFFILLKQGRKLLGKYNTTAQIAVMGFFLYCLFMDFVGKNAVGRDKVEGVFNNIINKVKSIF